MNANSRVKYGRMTSPKVTKHGRVMSSEGVPRESRAGEETTAGPAQNLARQDQSCNPPIAYLNGVQDFYGRDFIVTPDVLIPRPETEQIIDSVLNLAGKSYLPGVKPSQRKLPENPIILDVGTGSGCIAITLALELEDAIIYASDISKKALKIAQKNAKKHNTNIKFFFSNLLDNIPIIPDVIVANLPYVNENWSWLDKEALNCEPSIALYAEDGGLKLIKELIIEAGKRQIKYIILESDPSEHKEITKFAKENKYDTIDTRGYIQSFKYK